MTKINDGGPAFPFISWRSPDGMIGMNATEGMSLRDWFAAQAIGHVMGSISGAKMPSVATFDVVADVVAEHSYAIADAMLRQRSKSKEQGT